MHPFTRSSGRHNHISNCYIRWHNLIICTSQTLSTEKHVISQHFVAFVYDKRCQKNPDWTFLWVLALGDLCLSRAASQQIYGFKGSKVPALCDLHTTCRWCRSNNAWSSGVTRGRVFLFLSDQDRARMFHLAYMGSFVAARNHASISVTSPVTDKQTHFIRWLREVNNENVWKHFMQINKLISQ